LQVTSSHYYDGIDSIDEHVDLFDKTLIFLDISVISGQLDLPHVETNCQTFEKRTANGAQ